MLISTDLCSRGLDFPAVDHVVNFNFPTDAISFIHRIGRTGRLGKPAKITNFIRPQDEFLFEKINDLIKKNKELEEVFSSRRSLNKNYTNKTISTAETTNKVKKIVNGKKGDDSESDELTLGDDSN